MFGALKYINIGPSVYSNEENESLINQRLQSSDIIIWISQIVYQDCFDICSRMSPDISGISQTEATFVIPN